MADSTYEGSNDRLSPSEMQEQYDAAEVLLRMKYAERERDESDNETIDGGDEEMMTKNGYTAGASVDKFIYDGIRDSILSGAFGGEAVHLPQELANTSKSSCPISPVCDHARCAAILKSIRKWLARAALHDTGLDFRTSRIARSNAREARRRAEGLRQTIVNQAMREADPVPVADNTRPGPDLYMGGSVERSAVEVRRRCPETMETSIVTSDTEGEEQDEVMHEIDAEWQKKEQKRLEKNRKARERRRKKNAEAQEAAAQEETAAQEEPAQDADEEEGEPQRKKRRRG